MKFKGQYINGPIRSGEASFNSANPAMDNETVFEAQNASQSQIDDAITSARAAAANWRRLKFEERANIMMRVADRVENHADAIANAISLEMGKAHRRLWSKHVPSKAKLSEVFGKYPTSCLQRRQARLVSSDFTPWALWA